MLRWAVLWDIGMRGKTYLTGEGFLTQVGFSQPPSWSHEAPLLAPWSTHSACLAWPPCHSFPHLCPSCSLGRSLRPGVTSPSSSYPSAQSDAWCAAYSRFLGMYTEIRSCWEFQQGTQGFSEADTQPAHQGAGELTKALEDMSPRGWAKTQEENQDYK